jgi:hypothetical protein
VSDEQIGAAIRRASETVSAPHALRERLAQPRPRRPLLVPRVAFGGALAALVVALVLVLAGGGPTVTQVASAALRPPTADAATEPYKGGWEPVGERSDEVGGRKARTVVYRKDGKGVHYTIVGGKPIDRPSGRTVVVDGQSYTLLRDGKTVIATWQRWGHTCVLASRVTDWNGLVDFLRAYS